MSWGTWTIHKKLWEEPNGIVDNANRIFPTPDSKFASVKVTRTFRVRHEQEESPKIGREKTWLLHRKHLEEVTAVEGSPDHVITLITGEWSAHIAYSHKSMMEICEKAGVLKDRDALKEPMVAKDVPEFATYCSMCSMTRE